MSSKPLFLLCNDDGVHAPGIRALAKAVQPLGDVVIVAPHVERSAASHAITIHTPLRLEEIGKGIFAVEGTPADCVMLAIQQILPRRPTWVLSGINRGGNLGHDTWYSGTVGAASEGFMSGCRAMAISSEGREPILYDTAGRIVRMLLENESYLEAARQGVLNINVPNVPFEDLKGITVATLGRRVYDNQMQMGMDPRGRGYYWIGGGGRTHEEIPGSDCVVVADGYVSMTILRPDMYDHEGSQQLNKAIPKAWKSLSKSP